MLQSSSNSDPSRVPVPSPKGVKRPYRWWFAFALPLWVFTGFAVSQILIQSLLLGFSYLGVPFAQVNQAVLNTVTAAFVYILTLVIVIGFPWWLKKRRTAMWEIGLARLPNWTDIGLAPVGFVIYLLASAVLMYVISQLIPGFNVNEAQNVGFDNISQYFEHLLAFVTLVIIAPIAEEILFRGYLYGKLRKAVPLWAAIFITSVLFGFIHGRWNVAVDVFVLSIVMCGLREITGSIWAGILLHMIKNGLAFYLLFINPSLLNTMGG